MILGFYFGSEKLLQRYSFLAKNLNLMNIYQIHGRGLSYVKRVDLAKFAFIEFKKFIFFGYGGGGFEIRAKDKLSELIK